MNAYVRFIIGMAAVLLTHIDKPVEIPIIASVVRNDGMPMRVVMRPLKKPTAAPVANPAAMPAGIPAARIVIAVTTEENPAREPTERSISPAARTNVMATAITAIIADWRTMLRRLFGLRNPWLLRVTAKIAKMQTNPI